MMGMHRRFLALSRRSQRSALKTRCFSILCSSLWLIIFVYWNKTQLLKSGRELGTSEDAALTPLLAGRNQLQSRTAWRPIIVGGDLAGGFGNQVEVMLQQVSLIAKHSGTEYLVPPLRKRVGGKLVPPDEVWNFGSLGKLIKKLHKDTPAVCDAQVGGKWDVVVMPPAQAVRTSYKESKQPGILSSTLARNGTVYATLEYRYGMTSLSPGALRPFLERLLEYRSSKSTPAMAERDAKRSAVCVYLGIHSHDVALEYAKFLQPSSKYSEISSTWPLQSMAVIHLRYDEMKGGCGSGPPVGIDPAKHVCTFKETGVRETVWIPQTTYVAKLSNLFKSKRISVVYLTKSPYMTEQAWNALRQEFKKVPRLKVARNAGEDGYTGEDLNYVERALATRCRLFIAEARSTWSATVKAIRSNNEATVVAGKIFADYSPIAASTPSREQYKSKKRP